MPIWADIDGVRRRFSYGQISLAIGVIVIAVLVVNALTHAKPSADKATQGYTACPAGTPDACAGLVAKALGNTGQHLPSIVAPKGLTYDRGFIANPTKPAAALYVFDAFIDGSTHATEVTLRVSPASSSPYDVKHRGGELGHLPSGRTYLDFSTGNRSGPFVEHVGGLEFVMSWNSSAAPTTLRTSKLALLDSITAPPTPPG